MRRTFPVVLLLLGLYLIVGCIPIPATQQYLTNGKLKPRYSIGESESSPIRIRYTTLDRAIEVLDELLAGVVPANFAGAPLSTKAEEWKHTWIAFDDGRHFALPYEKRTATWVFPLCFFMTITDSDIEYIVLETDEQRHVIDYETVSREAWARHWAGRPQHLLFPPPPAQQVGVPSTSQP